MSQRRVVLAHEGESQPPWRRGSAQHLNGVERSIFSRQVRGKVTARSDQRYAGRLIAETHARLPGAIGEYWPRRVKHIPHSSVPRQGAGNREVPLYCADNRLCGVPFRLNRIPDQAQFISYAIDVNAKSSLVTEK